MCQYDSNPDRAEQNKIGVFRNTTEQRSRPVAPMFTWRPSVCVLVVVVPFETWLGTYTTRPASNGSSIPCINRIVSHLVS